MTRALSLHRYLCPLPCPEPSPPVPLPSQAQPMHCRHCPCCRCPCRHLSPLSVSSSPGPTRPCPRSLQPLLVVSPVLLCPTLPLPHDWTTAMVRTRGGYRYRLRVRFSTPERDDAGTPRAADAHSPDLPTETQSALASAAIPEEPQASEPPSR